MSSDSEAADLLEKAADLYESEEIDWCKGSWGTTVNYSEDGEITRGQFHCAEGALLRASGLSMADIGRRMAAPEVLKNRVMLGIPVIDRAARAVNRHLDSAINGNVLHPYNDRLPEDTAKQTLIEVFKKTAKELRNGS